MSEKRRPLRLFARDHAEFDRGLGFFDAIYGFAITLLVANIDIPPAEAWQSLATLLSHGLMDQLFGFAISFIVIAVFWLRNTELLGRFTGLDGPVIVMNLVTTFFIVLLPFTTQGISDSELNDLPLPTALYAANVALAMLSLAIMTEVGRARGLAPSLSRSQHLREWVDIGAKVGVFVVSIPVAYVVDANWGQLTWLALLVVAPLTGRFQTRAAP